MEKGARKSFKGFRKALAYISMFAMMLGLIEPAFVMKVEAATPITDYPVTIHFYDTDFSTLKAPTKLPAAAAGYSYHVVLTLKDNTKQDWEAGKEAGWGFVDIDPTAANQTVHVTKFGKVPTDQTSTVWEEMSYDSDRYTISARMRYGKKIEVVGAETSVSYADMKNQQDTFSDYKFLGTTSGTDSATINIGENDGSTDYNYVIRINFDKATSISGDDELYVLTTVMHHTGSNTYYKEKLVTNGAVKKIEIPVTDWYDENGNKKNSEVYNGSEKGVSVKLVKGDGQELNMNMIRNHNHCYDVEGGKDVVGCKVSYDGLTVSGSTHYDVINMTKIVPTRDYTFLTVLDNAVNYGVVSNKITQVDHSETNVATKEYNQQSSNLEPDLSGDGDTQVPGTFLIGKITSSKFTLGQKTPATPIVVTSDTSKILDQGATSVKVTMAEDDVNAKVQEMITHMTTVSDDMASHEATISPLLENNKYVYIDTTGFADGTTIYLNGDDYVSAISQAAGGGQGVHIKMLPNQLVVFNFTKTDSITLAKVMVDSGSGEQNSNTETGKFGSAQNTAADILSQHVVWNLNKVKTVTTVETGGMILVPRTDSTLNLGGTSCGWAVCAGETKLGVGGEFHFVYRGLKSQPSVQLSARKLVNNKNAASDEVFRFGIEKYKDGTFKQVMVDDPENAGVKIPYVLKNDSGSITFPITEMDVEGTQIYRIFEYGKDDTTEGFYEYDSTKYYAVFDVTKDTSGSSTVYLPGAVKYYKATSDDGSDVMTTIAGSAIAKSSVVFKNTSTSSFTLTKTVTGDPHLSTMSFKVVLHGVAADQTTPLSGSYAVEGIEGTSTLVFTAGKTDAFYIKEDSSVYVAGLPVGAKITVEEIADAMPDGYTLQTTALTATVNTSNTAKVALVNKYMATKKGNLKVTKSVFGDLDDPSFDANKKYPVTVTLDASGYYVAEVYNALDKLQSSTDTYFAADTPVEFKLADQEYVLINGIPTDVTYMVGEVLTAAEEAEGYHLSGIVDMDDKNIVPSNVDNNKTTKVIVKNKYSARGSLKVTKKVIGVGYDTNKEFQIKVSFGTAGSYLVTYRGQTTKEAFIKDTPKIYSLKADETVEFSDVPMDTTYAVTENAPADVSYAFSSFSGDSTTGNGKIVKNAVRQVNVNNTYSETGGNLKITKKIEGEGYDATKEYEIKVKFGKTGMYDVKKNGGSAEATPFTANEEKKFTLKVGEYIEIEGIPDGVTYTVTETDLNDVYKNAGYSKNGFSGDTTNGKGTIVKGETKSVDVNNKYVKPDTGSLKITKKMDGTGYDTAKTYEVEVAFNKTGEYGVKINGQPAVAKVFTANTAIAYNLKVNEYIEIEGIPVGTTYTITEKDLSDADKTAGYSKVGFSGDSTNGKGTITKDTIQSVNVDNKYEKNEEGSLKITKVMEGTDGAGYDASKKYEISVTFNKTGKYKVSINGAAPVEKEFTAGNAAKYSLKAGEYVEFSEVPDGVTYTVAETDLSVADQTAGYSKNGMDGDVTTSGQGTIVKDTTKNVNVKNKYTVTELGELLITKVMSGTDGTGYDASKEYEVNVTFDKTGNYQVSVNNGAAAAKVFTAGEVESYKLKVGGTVKISGIPAGTVYTVTETDLSIADKTAGYSRVNVTGAVDADGKGTIVKDTTKTVMVNNKYEIVEIGELEITKTMTGTGYDTTKEYTVNVSFNETGSYKVKINDGAETAKTFTADQAETYTVKVGDKIRISGVPENVRYTVTEADLSDVDVTAGYSKDGFGGDTNDGTGLIVRNTTKAVKVQNKFVKPETGSLQITKKMTGTGYDVNKSYEIKVVFDKTGNYKVKINNGEENTKLFSAGTEVAYSVKVGDVILITDVPENVNYTVTETAPTGEGYSFDGFTGNTTDGTGAIVKGTVQIVDINNKYEKTVIETGSLKITKKMTGTGYDANKAYEVKVTFNAGGNYDVSYNGGTSVSTPFTGGKAWVCQLKADETVEIGNIPTGTTYTVAETALNGTEQALGYQNGSITPESGSISNGLTAVTVNNTYEAPKGSLYIKKVVTGDTTALNYDANKTYEVMVTFEQSGTYEVKQGGTTTLKAFGAGVKQPFAVKAGETIEINNVLVGTKYSVEEAELSDPDKAAGYANGAITNKTGEIKTTPVTATVNNTYTKQTEALTLRKTVQNPDGASLPSSYKVAVRDENNQYAQDVTGNFDTAEHYFDVSTGDAGAVSITGLEIGQTYVIEEDEVKARVSDYDLDVTGDVSVKIKMVSGGKIANIINSYKAKGTGPVKYNVTISKRAEGADVELTGATLQVKSSDGTYETSWVSMGTSRVLQLAVGTYTLTEIEAPEGYAVADPITFTISTAGAVEIGGTAIGNTITMIDKLDQFDVKISKQAVGGGDELVNAKLEVKSADGGSYYKSWISDGNLTTLQLEKGKYTLTETQAPNNYEIAESITFEVTADGKVVVDGKYVTANTVTMFDALKKKPVSLTKIDAFNSEEIAGANLVLYKIKADSSLEELTSWISSATEVYTFTLEAGDYAIKETVAPDGYELVESLVKFNLSFDAEGNPVTTVTEGPGVYNAVEDKISFKDDPIKVTGGLTITVLDEVTGGPVPDAVVDVTEPDGATQEYTTDLNGQVTKYRTGAVLGAYRIRVKQVPEGYTVTVNQEQEETVEENTVKEVISKINTVSGALTIQVLDKVTSAPVPDATVEVTEPDDTVKTYTTDENGRVNTYMDKDGTGHYTAKLGTYKIRVIRVPEGYTVDTGITGTETVVVGQVVEHIAKIVTKTEIKPETKPETKTDDDDEDDDDDDDMPANVPESTSELQEETVSGTTRKSLTGGARRTITESAMSLRTGEAHTATYMFGGSMAALFMGAVAYVLSKRKKEK